MNKLFIFSVFVILLVFSPIGLLVYYGFGPEANQIGSSQEVISSILLTLVSSLFASLIQIIALTPAAYYLSRHSNPILEIFSNLPASIPHPVIGIALLLMNSPLTPIGSFMHMIGIDFFNTFLGLVLALFVISSPIYLNSILSYFISLPEEPEIYAMGLGASETKVFLDVVLPNSWKGVLYAFLISTSRSISEFGSISIIAYSILQYPFYGISPASILIYKYYSFYGLGPSLTASALLVLIGAIFMIVLRTLSIELRIDRRKD